MVCLLVMVCALPKNMQARREDKRVFKEIGDFIAIRENNHNDIRVATSRATQQWIAFYSNVNHKNAPCPMLDRNSWEYFPNDYESFIGVMKERGIKYLLWVERHWTPDKFDITNEKANRAMIQLGYWGHPDTGRMILFEMI